VSKLAGNVLQPCDEAKCAVGLAGVGFFARVLLAVRLCVKCKRCFWLPC